jgi:hypothetical protein
MPKLRIIVGEIISRVENLSLPAPYFLLLQWRLSASYTGVQLKIGPYFNMGNLFTKIYKMLYYTTNLYLQ